VEVVFTFFLDVFTAEMVAFSYVGSLSCLCLRGIVVTLHFGDYLDIALQNSFPLNEIYA
jgi:hypothetical protein